MRFATKFAIAIIGSNFLPVASDAPAAEIPGAQLETQVQGREVFAVAFRGRWAKRGDCGAQSQSLVEITENHLYGYESDALLLKSTTMTFQPQDDGGWAYTVVVLTAQRAESDVDFAKLRLSLWNDRLYLSQAGAVPEDEHLTEAYALVRCR